MNSVSEIWKNVLDILLEDLPETVVNTWFRDCDSVELRDNKLYVSSPSDFRVATIKSHYMGILNKAVYRLFAREIEIIFLSQKETENYRKNRETPVPLIDSGDFTFDNFIVGNSNKFAHAAAKAVAAGNTRNFNPLFIYGDSGLGKTHLLYAIRHEVMKNHPEYNIVYVKGDDFTNEMIDAIKNGRNIEFREKYRFADLFLMDDIQFIGGKTGTQEEFFHTFNTLYELNKQIVFTSDRPPNEMTLLADRLKTRFESGVLTNIEPPDYETRAAIIRNKSEQLGQLLSDEVVAYLAENMTANVRQIEGSVKKLAAFHDLVGGTITVTEAAKIVKDLFREKNENLPTPDEIIEATAQYYNLTAEDLRGQRRTRNTAQARQVSMYIIRKLTNFSLADIGTLYAGRDHTTVLSSIKKVEDSMTVSDAFAQEVRDITSTVNNKR